MGLKLITDDKPVKVIAKEKVSKAGNNYMRYSLMTSSKDTNGNWVNGFIDCAFKKGVVVADKSKITIQNAFPIVEEYQGKSYIKYMITEFNVVEQGVGASTTGDVSTAEFMNVPDDMDMPFAATFSR